MPKLINTIRFLQYGKEPPSGSRFKGKITTNTVFGTGGWFDYSVRPDAVGNEKTDGMDVDDKGFIGYTSRETAAEGMIMSSIGWLNKDKKNEFIENARNHFSKEGDIIWDLVVSIENYDTAFSHNLYSQTDYARACQQVLPKFFKKLGLENNNVSWWEAYHNNKKNPHMHICFFEKVKTRSKGKITPSQLKSLKTLLIQQLLTDRELETQTGISKNDFFRKKDEVKGKLVSEIKRLDLSKIKDLKDLYNNLPTTGRLQYNSSHMIPYREKLDSFTEQFLNQKSIRPFYEDYLDKINLLQTLINESNGTSITKIKETELKKLKCEIGNIILAAHKETTEIETTNKTIIRDDTNFDFDGAYIDEEDSGQEYVDHASKKGYKRFDFWNEDYKLGLKYLYGSKDIAKNINKAWKLFSCEANKGNPLAMSIMAKMIEQENTINNTEFSSQEWYKKSYNRFQEIDHLDYENPYWKYRMGKFHLYGMGMEVDYHKAKEMFEKTIWYNYSKLALGNIHENGLGIEKNYNIAFELYSESNVLLALYRAAELIRNGKIHNQTNENMESLYNYVSNQIIKEDKKNGINDDLRYILAGLQDKGLGIDVDKESAYRNFKRVAESGNSHAAYKAADILEKNEIHSIKNNDDIEYLRKLGYKLAERDCYMKETDYTLLKLAYLNYKGNGCNKDFHKALELCERAISKNDKNENAQNLMINILIKTGEFKRVIPILKNQVEKQNTSAMFQLGILYIKGNGIEKNKKLGLEFIEQAAKLGNQTALKYMNNTSSGRRGKVSIDNHINSKLQDLLNNLSKKIQDEIDYYLNNRNYEK